MAGKAWLASFSVLLASSAVMAEDLEPLEMREGQVAGYLKPSELPDALALLPPPPTLTSAAESLDQQAARDSLAMRGSERFQLATLDADLTFPNAAGTFACSIGVAITEADTPTLYRLLHRMEADAGAATGKAKNHYRHARPFLLDNAPTCHTSKQEETLRKSGSYPSGHTSIGWAWAETLAEIAPDQADAILQRGRAFGDSRIVCNAHWVSDVQAGRMIGSATVARLRADADYRADVEAAKTEVAAARAKGLPPQRDCAAEAAALKGTPWLSP